MPWVWQVQLSHLASSVQLKCGPIDSNMKKYKMCEPSCTTQQFHRNLTGWADLLVSESKQATGLQLREAWYT